MNKKKMPLVANFGWPLSSLLSISNCSLHSWNNLKCFLPLPTSFQLTQKCFIFGNNLCYFQSKLPMKPSYSPSFPINHHKFLQLFSIFLFIIPSFLSFPSIDNKQELAKIAECAHRKTSTKDRPFICDPHSILSPMERHKIHHLLMDRLLDKIGKNSDKNNSPCIQKGILDAGIIISHWPIPDQFFGQHYSLDPECQKYILFLLPIFEPNQISIIHGSGVPLNGGQLHFTLEYEKPLFQQGHYLEGISAIFDQIRLLMDQSEIQRIYRVQIEERRKQLDEKRGELLVEEEKMNRENAEMAMMTQSFMALIASCAVIFSIGLCMAVFAIFYYVSIVRHGGMACWGTECRATEKSGGGVYFVKEVSLEGTTILEELVGVP